MGLRGMWRYLLDAQTSAWHSTMRTKTMSCTEVRVLQLCLLRCVLGGMDWCHTGPFESGSERLSFC